MCHQHVLVILDNLWNKGIVYLEIIMVRLLEDIDLVFKKKREKDKKYMEECGSLVILVKSLKNQVMIFVRKE